MPTLRHPRRVVTCLLTAGLLLTAAACGSPSASAPRARTPLIGAPLSPASPNATATPTRRLTRTSTTPSTTTTPSTQPATPGTSKSRHCTVGRDLVPTCGMLWGAAAGGFSSTPREEALKKWEATSGAPTTIFHTYHSGDQLFPTAAEIAMAHQPGHPRILLLNWKVAAGSTWAKVAAGDEDARIDREAAYLKRTFSDPFFLVLHHEPEDSVNTDPAKGMTAADFAAMFRHTVLRLRADGVGNAITVVVYMNYEKFENEPWWPQLYPGDDVVDWIGVDSYLNAGPGTFHTGGFASMMNRTTKPATFPGFYRWATTKHPSKPLMLAEWGVYGSAAKKPSVFATVLPDLHAFPALKAMVYFDTVKDQDGRDIAINTSAASTAAFRTIAESSLFNVYLPAR
jgi:hypothetical protein